MLKLAEMEYNGANSIFLRLLLDKKYALPFRVLDALVAHFLSFRSEKRELPVLWHQSLLTLAQRYKADLASEQKEALLELLKIQTHPPISAEIRRELQNSESRDIEIGLPVTVQMDWFSVVFFLSNVSAAWKESWIFLSMIGQFAEITVSWRLHISKCTSLWCFPTDAHGQLCEHTKTGFCVHLNKTNYVALKQKKLLKTNWILKNWPSMSIYYLYLLKSSVAVVKCSVCWINK